MFHAEPLTTRLENHASRTPDQPAIASAQKSLSYRELAELVAQQTCQLRESGIDSSSLVGIQCAAEIDHLTWCLAVDSLGASSCTLPSRASSEQTDGLARQFSATHIARVQSDNAALVKYTGGAGTPQAEACYIFSTSGTTGSAKNVVQTSGSIVIQAPRHVQAQNERFACSAHIDHNFAKRHRLYCIAQGGCNVFLDARNTNLVGQCLALGVSVLHLSAFQARELVSLAGADALSSLRLKLGGSHVPMHLRRTLRDRITKHVEFGYGTTETGAIAFSDPADIDDPHAGETVGRALPGIRIRIVDDYRRDVADGGVGEIVIGGPGLFSGYQGQPEKTAERVQNGWFYTGDIGCLDAEQRLTVSGRADDMFVFNSMNIYPQELEAVLLQHELLADVAILPRTSPVHGDIPVAIIVWASGQPDLAALKRHAKQHLGARTPRQWIPVDAVPRNSAGKILRRDAAQLAGIS